MNLFQAIFYFVIAHALIAEAFKPDFDSLRLSETPRRHESLAAPFCRDRYIVVLSPFGDIKNVYSRVASLTSNSVFRGVQDSFYFSPNHHGLIAHMSAASVEALSSDPNIDYIEQDTVVTLDISKSKRRRSQKKLNQYDVEHSAPWGLARICQRQVPANYDFSTFRYSKSAGNGVTAYVIDSGTFIEHEEFEGRARWGVTIPGGDEDADNVGHGTHVSATIAGKTFGVAKNASIVAVKVFRSDGSGALSDIILGIQWAVNDHKAQKEQLRKAKAKANRDRKLTPSARRRLNQENSKQVKSVINMSFNGPFSKALNNAAKSAIEADILVTVAAGNDDDNSCYISPAGAEGVITVGATNITDERTWFSNYGPCTDIFAPGFDIKSAGIDSKNATKIMSGTSMSAPHVTGVLALWLSEKRFERLSPAELKNELFTRATNGTVHRLPSWSDTPNKLLYSL